MTVPPRHVRRLVEDDAWGPLLRAADVEPPAGAQERILKTLHEAHAPLAQGIDAVARIVAEAAGTEPAENARDQIWRALESEALARSGVADPVRLVDSDPALRPVLVPTTRTEPPLGSRARVLRRVEPRRASPALGFAVMAVAAALAFVMLRPPPAPPAPVVAEVNAPSPAPLAMQPVEGLAHLGAQPGALAVGDTVEVTRNAPVRFTVNGVGDIALSGLNARLSLVKNSSQGVELRLAGGLVAIHADKRRREAPLTVVSGDTRVEVVGTVFAVESQGESAHVAVFEGLVEVTRGAEVRRVGAGQKWDVGASLSRESPSDAAASLLATFAPAPVPSAPAATPAPAPTVAAVAPKPARALAAPVPAPVITAPPPEEKPAAPARFDFALAAKPHLGRTIAELRDLARDAARRGDVTQEAAVLYALAQAPQATPEESANALTQAAMLADVELGAPLEALSAWRKLAQGTDAAAEEARFRVLMLSVEMGRNDEALAAADECHRACAQGRREIALYAKAVALRETPEYGAALKEARTAAPEALVTAARTFAHRALELRFQQPDRAARDARIAARLDPTGLAPEIRALARP